MRIMSVIILVFGVAYFYTDRQLFFYGKSDLNIYKPLSINVKPDYWGYDKGNLGFVIVDDFDFTIVEKGRNRYRSSEVFVHEILKYGYGEEKLIVVVIDSVGHKYFLTLQTKNNSEIEVSLDTKGDYIGLTWIEIKDKEEYVKQLEWIRAFIRIALFILIVIAGFMVARVLMRRRTIPTISKN